MRGYVSLYWKLVAWSYRRQIAAQNKHGAAVNRRIAELKDKARDAERRAADVMGATGSGSATGKGGASGTGGSTPSRGA